MQLNDQVMKKCILLGIMFILCLSCNPKKRKLQQIVRQWIGKEVIFAGTEAKVLGCDTVWEDWQTSRFKILHYVDTSGCTSCRLRLYEWGQFIDSMAVEFPETAVVFVLTLENYKEFEQLAKINRFDFPVLYDREGRMDSLNHFPAIPALQTFLLDGNNQVLAIGDPVKNEAVRQLYRKKMKP